MLRNDLEAALIAQGLFPKEAQAMVATWNDSWFEEGSRLIYILPTPRCLSGAAASRAAISRVFPTQNKRGW